MSEVIKPYGLKRTIYVFINMRASGHFSYISALALSEDGEIITGHVCSSEAFVCHDMGIDSDRKHDIYDEFYPSGWELEYIKDIEKEYKNNKKFKKAIDKGGGFIV